MRIPGQRKRHPMVSKLAEQRYDRWKVGWCVAALSDVPEQQIEELSLKDVARGYRGVLEY